MKKYEDQYGDIWIKISDSRVKRISDGNIGGWFNGSGLTELGANTN